MNKFYSISAIVLAMVAVVGTTFIGWMVGRTHKPDDEPKVVVNSAVITDRLGYTFTNDYAIIEKKAGGPMIMSFPTPRTIKVELYQPIYLSNVFECISEHEPNCTLIRYRDHGLTNEFHAWCVMTILVRQ